MADMLKIGFVLDDSLDTADGVQQYILTLGSWLASAGHEVHYLVGETKRGDIPNVHSLARNIKVRFNQNRMSIPLPARRRDIERVILREDFDILHVQLPHSPMMAAKAVSLAPPRTAVIGTFHVLPFSRRHERANTALALVLKRNLAKFHAIVSVSPAAQAFAKKTYGIDSTVIPNAVDTMRYRVARPFAYSDSRKRIVFVGRLVERKGCEYLLRALAKLYEHGITDWAADICGKGEHEAKLKSFVREHRLQDAVTFHGFVSEDDKARYLAGADIAVFPSLGGESFGIVLIEAMAAGSKVVLGGDNPGYATVLRKEQLFNPRSIRALAETLQHYLADDVAIQQASLWQRHNVKRYDIGVVGSQVLALYRQTLHRRGS